MLKKMLPLPIEIDGVENNYQMILKRFRILNILIGNIP
jgi:hypothetical protein